MSHERRLDGRLLLLLSGLSALGALSTNIMLPSFPAMGLAFDVPTHALGLTLSSFFIAFALGQLAVGPLSDRFGRRPLVLGGLLVFLCGSAICVVAPDLPTLIAGRVVQALGACAASVLSRAIARDLFDGAALTRALALIMVAMSAAPGLSPLVGGAIGTYLGWRYAFVFVGVLGAALSVYYWRGMGETLPAARRLVVPVGDIARSYGQLLRDPRFIRPAFSVSLVIAGLYTFFGLAPAILMESLGFSALELGLFFALTVIVVFASGLIAPRLAQRHGPRPVALAGLVLALLGGGILLASAPLLDTLRFSVAITVFLIGMGMVNPVVTAMTLQPFGQQAGLASALLGFLQMGCAAVATALPAALGMGVATSLGWVLLGVIVLALLVFPSRTPAVVAA